jgi:hypothetical protein
VVLFGILGSFGPDRADVPDPVCLDKLGPAVALI